VQADRVSEMYKDLAALISRLPSMDRGSALA
jgi:hypothetical protein